MRQRGTGAFKGVVKLYGIFGAVFYLAYLAAQYL